MQAELTALQRRTMEALDSRLSEIALLPSVISRLAALDMDAPGATDEIIGLVRSDPPLALRLLRLANATVAGTAEIDTIPGAILRVGTKGLARTILALAVVEVFVPRTRGQRNLWIHSIQTAVAARRIAEVRPEAGLGGEECYLAGLLHDIGRFVIFENRPHELAQIDESDVRGPRELIEAERRVCGFDHAALGYEVCRRWRMPEPVSEMVRAHHHYGESRRRVPQEVAGMVQLVQEADCLSFGLLHMPEEEEGRSRAVEGALRPLGLTERTVPAAKLEELVQEVEAEAREAAAMINIAYA